MQERIIGILKEMTPEGSVEINYSGETDIINEVGLDSLGMVNFLLRIEKELDVEIDISKLRVSHLNSINSLCNFINAKSI